MYDQQQTTFKTMTSSSGASGIRQIYSLPFMCRTDHNNNNYFILATLGTCYR
jgi:hypothetical protein